MNRSFRDEKIRDTYGYGISDVFKNMFNSATKKIASESTKKIAKSAIESAAKSSADVLGKKSAEVLANKIFNNSDNKKTDPLIDQMPINNDVIPNKGVIIEKELKKIYKTDDDIDNILLRHRPSSLQSCTR